MADGIGLRTRVKLAALPPVKVEGEAQAEAETEGEGETQPQAESEVETAQTQEQVETEVATDAPAQLDDGSAAVSQSGNPTADEESAGDSDGNDTGNDTPQEIPQEIPQETPTDIDSRRDPHEKMLVNLKYNDREEAKTFMKSNRKLLQAMRQEERRRKMGVAAFKHERVGALEDMALGKPGAGDTATSAQETPQENSQNTDATALGATAPRPMEQRVVAAPDPATAGALSAAQSVARFATGPAQAGPHKPRLQPGGLIMTLNPKKRARADSKPLRGIDGNSGVTAAARDSSDALAATASAAISLQQQQDPTTPVQSKKRALGQGIAAAPSGAAATPSLVSLGPMRGSFPAPSRHTMTVVPLDSHNYDDFALKRATHDFSSGANADAADKAAATAVATSTENTPSGKAADTGNGPNSGNPLSTLLATPIELVCRDGFFFHKDEPCAPIATGEYLEFRFSPKAKQLQIENAANLERKGTGFQVATLTKHDRTNSHFIRHDVSLENDEACRILSRITLTERYVNTLEYFLMEFKWENKLVALGWSLRESKRTWQRRKALFALFEFWREQSQVKRGFPRYTIMHAVKEMENYRIFINRSVSWFYNHITLLKMILYDLCDNVDSQWREWMFPRGSSPPVLGETTADGTLVTEDNLNALIDNMLTLDFLDDGSKNKQIKSSQMIAPSPPHDFH